MVLKTFFSVVLAVVVVSGATAQPIDQYFKAPYDCAKKHYLIGHFSAEWHVSGDLQKTASFNLILREISNGGLSLKGIQERVWKVPGPIGSSIELEGRNGKPLYRVIGLGSATPKVQELDSKGNVLENCTQTLNETAHPTDRYQDILSLLKADNPTPDIAAEINPKIDDLPPVEMLPALDRAETIKALKKALNEFWERYNSTSLAAAGTLSNSNILEDLTRLWLETPKNSNKQWHEQILLAAQAKRGAALIDAEEDVTQMRASGGDALCGRIDAEKTSRKWRDILELSTGLPVRYWSRDIAQGFIDGSAQCERGEAFTKIVSKHWNEIQENVAGFAFLVSERARLEKVEPSLNTIQAENWFQISTATLRTLNRQGIGSKEAKAFLEPVYIQKREASIEPAVKELLHGIETGDVELKDYPKHCANRRKNIGRQNRSELFKDIFTACEKEVASRFEEQALKVIARQTADYLAAPVNATTLVETDGYSFDKIFPNLRNGSTNFQPAFTRIQAALDAAKIQTDPLYQRALEKTKQDLTAVYNAAQPFTPSEETALASCTQFERVSSRRLQPISKHCWKLNNDFQQRREQARCDKVWSEIDAPENLQQGRLRAVSVFGKQAIQIRDVICSSYKDRMDLTIVNNSGFFSTEYRIVRKMKISGAEVTFSATLNEPDTEGAVWTLSDAEITPGKINYNRFGNDSDGLIGCMYFLDACYRP
ncbi:hypothetical protein [Profundibacter sp.]